jgi:hypothetical protein
MRERDVELEAIDYALKFYHLPSKVAQARRLIQIFLGVHDAAVFKRCSTTIKRDGTLEMTPTNE